MAIEKAETKKIMLRSLKVLASVMMLMAWKGSADAAAATPASADLQVLQVDKAWVDAEGRHDEAFLRSLLLDNFVVTFDSSKPMGKEDMIGLVIGRLAAVATQQVLSERAVVIDHGVAIVTEKDAVTRTAKNGSQSFDARLTAVYVRHDGQWKALGLHFVTIPDAPAKP